MDRPTGNGIDPKKEYPNGLGLSTGEIIEGWESLARYYEDPKHREAARKRRVVMLKVTGPPPERS